MIAIARRHVPDYGPEIRPGARVLDQETDRLGWIVRLEDGCHWGCQETAPQWRPRRAYVLYDGRQPHGGEWHLLYLAPEHCVRVPAWWTGEMGARRDRPRPWRWTLLRHDGTRWWLQDRPEEGWSSFGHWYETREAGVAAWDVEVTECGWDDLGAWLRVVPGEA